jgi:dipeptidyl-peptidase-4
MTVLAAAEGWNAAVVSPESGLWVHYWSDADTPPRFAVRDADGREIAELPTRPPAFDPAALPHWRFFTLDGPDGSKLPARMLTPPDVKPDATAPQRRHPAIMYHYGGPGSQVVVNRWDGRGRDLWHKMMAQRGYAVLSVDNVASIFFGKRGEDRQHRRFGPLNLAAQQAAAAYLADQSWIDGSRIGLWGWSGGGFNTLYCLFESPGTWAAGMAGAPVTDWRLYDTIWTERYLDHPDDNAEGYELSSPIHRADRLADRLLVVHGTGDDNVHPQNTIALAAKLVAAGKPFEDALYPRQKHGFRGPAARHVYERMTRFFEDALAAQGEGEMSAGAMTAGEMSAGEMTDGAMEEEETGEGPMQ